MSFGRLPPLGRSHPSSNHPRPLSATQSLASIRGNASRSRHSQLPHPGLAALTLQERPTIRAEANLFYENEPIGGEDVLQGNPSSAGPIAAPYVRRLRTSERPCIQRLTTIFSAMGPGHCGDDIVHSSNIGTSYSMTQNRIDSRDTIPSTRTHHINRNPQQRLGYTNAIGITSRNLPQRVSNSGHFTSTDDEVSIPPVERPWGSLHVARMRRLRSEGVNPFMRLHRELAE